MKKFILLILFLASGILGAQELIKKDVDAPIKNVTVFLKGAQIHREAPVQLDPGVTEITFTGISPHLVRSSARVTAEGDLTMLSVQEQKEESNKIEKDKRLKEWQKRLLNLMDSLETEQAMLEILQEERSFLKSNLDLSRKPDATDVEQLKTAVNYYAEKMNGLKRQELKRSKKIEKWKKERDKTIQKIEAIFSDSDTLFYQIVVKVEASRPTETIFKFNYMVEHAGWYPSYDVRAKSVSDPISISYKANLQQQTLVDWNDVMLTFSSANPNQSGVAPDLKPYYLSFNSIPVSYGKRITRVSGRLTDTRGEPLIAAQVRVEGTTIGTVTDFSGDYSIMLPDKENNQLTFSYIGYKTKSVLVNNPIINVSLSESSVALEEVVVNRKSISNASYRTGRKSKKAKPIATPPRIVQYIKPTTVEFKVDQPYTISADGRNSEIKMITYKVPTHYEYISVPKLEEQAFLIAFISEWEDYNFLDGEANIYFEGTFVGKTVLNLETASDTLELSLGRDPSLAVQREKIKDFTDRQFIGSNQTETLSHKTTLKNNKKVAVKVVVKDQIPISTIDKIKVEATNLSGGILNEDNGELKWELELQPGEERSFILQYEVKYPKNKRLLLD